MFLRIVTKYGLAAHLALLASLPVALTPFLGGDALAGTVLWLCAFSLIWLLMEPALHSGEGLTDARKRVLLALVKDPFTWLFMTAIVIAAIRWLNSGISLFYDAEQTLWLVKDRALENMPGGVDGTGYLPFAVTLGVALTVQGIRHGLGPKGRAWFSIAASTVVGAGGLALTILALVGVEGFEKEALARYGAAPYMGSVFAGWAFVQIAAAAQAETYKWGYARFPFWLGMGGNIGAIALFMPPIEALSILGAVLVFSLFSVVYVMRSVSKGAMARILVILVFSILVPVLSYMLAANERVIADKTAQLDVESKKTMEAAAKAEAVEAVLDGIAQKVWLKSPWCGAGDGAYRLHLPFFATEEDWEHLPPTPGLPSNSYWALLSERGIVGAGVLATIVAFLLCTWGYRLVMGVIALKGESDIDIFPFAVSPLAWVAPLVLATMATDALWSSVFQLKSFLFTLAVPMALSAASFPRPKKK